LREPFPGRCDHRHHVVEREAPRPTIRATVDLDFEMPSLVVDLRPDDIVTDQIGDEVLTVGFTPDGIATFP
jgi:hypothetical protein